MFDVFGEVKKHIPTSGRRTPQVSSLILQVMKMTMLVTILSCVLVTAKQYIGQNINCVTQLMGVEHRAVENYCFISGTFTLPMLVEENSAHPGVGPKFIQPSEDELPKKIEEVKVHSYYQWVPIVLALQAGIFFLPILLWKQLDKGAFETTLCGLSSVYVDEETAAQHITAAVNYFKKTMRQHNSYALSFLAVEAFAFVIAISNLFITNAFLGGEFFAYGPAAIKYINTPAYDFTNPMNLIFPKVAKCTWHKYGPTGSIQTHDALCVLPLNIVNEKTYIFLWVFFLAAAFITGILLVWHIILFCSSRLRERFLLRLPMKRATKERLRTILEKSSLGDWFLIWNYKRNMMYFAEWTKQLSEELTH